MFCAIALPIIEHYFGVSCLLALGVAYGLQQRPRWALALVGTVTISAILAFTATDKKQLFVINFEPPDEWFWARARRVGSEIKQHVQDGPVLTLAPAWPLEIGLSIYPEFAQWPFGWRSAPFATKEKRVLMHLVRPEELGDLLATRSPAAILTGVEDDALEKPFVAYAEAQGWQRIPLSKQRVLWIPN